VANRHRGEIEACLNGKTWKLCLTLGALAELEDAFGCEDMLALAERFEKGRLSANDAVRIIGAGLRGAGYDVSDDDVRKMRSDSGVLEFIDVVTRLLSATFGSPEKQDDAAREEARNPAPFPGMTS